MNAAAGSLADRLRRAHQERTDPGARLRIVPASEPGPGGRSAAELDHWAGLHYRRGRPPTPSWCWRLVDPDHAGETVGVLVVSRPVLNGRWRSIAWPGRFDDPDPRKRARVINRELRVISRVLIDPRYRALGLATRLVRAYLANPLTPCTEALAAMGAVCPFFARAGMRALRPPESRRNRRLLAVLSAGAIEPWRLACPAALPRGVVDDLEAPLRRWAGDSRATARQAGGPIEGLFLLAAQGLCGQCVYVAGPEPGPGQDLGQAPGLEPSFGPPVEHAAAAINPPAPHQKGAVQ